MAGARWKRRDEVQAMPIEIFSFLVIAASLVLVGFASGPLVARRVTVEHRRRVR